MATTAAIASPTGPSRRKGGSKRPADDVDKDASVAAKRVKSDGETSPGHNSDGAVPAEEREEVAVPAEPSNGTAASKAASLLGWPVEELNQLVKNLERCLPANDLVKYTTMVEKVDWEKVRFSAYTAAQCKEKWMQLMQKLRRYRTLTDMVVDAYAWLQQPGGGGNGRRGRNPALPKKPLTPYFRYFLEKRAKYARENPELSMTQLAKLLSTKFQQLSDKKKQKYKDSFEKDNAIYKAELKKFKKEHPEEYPEPVPKQTPADGAPGKPQTPFQLFAAERLKRPDFANLDKKEAQEEVRRQWTELSDGKRLKWIRRALQGQHRYQEEVAEYSQAFPGFKAANTKPVLSKAEKEFKDKCEGKPERPPNSGYSLFSRIMLRQLKNVPAKEKMGEISRLWKGLSQSERDSYNKQATKANAKYKEKYAAYLSNLPEEERLKLESEVATPKGAGGNAAVKKAAAASPPQQNGTTGGDENQPPKEERPKPKKPLSAMFFFQQEKVAQVREKHPDMSKQEIMRLLAREFSELPDRKKEKYQKMAAEAKQKVEEETNGYKVKEEKVSTPHPSKRQKLYKGEPKKPPQSGYGVFSTEMLSQLVDVDPKQRMAEIARRWNAMPDEDKERYKNMVQDLQKKYAKELRKFLENLSPEDRAQYEELQARIKDQRKGGGAAAAKATSKAKAKSKGKEQEAAAAAAAAEKEAEESSSSSSESSSEEESSEEEEEDEEEQGKKEKQKEGGSEEESESSSEASDSDSDSSSSSEEDAENATQQRPAAGTKKVEEAANAEDSSDSDSSEDSSDEEDDDDDDDDDSSDSDADSK